MSRPSGFTDAELAAAAWKRNMQLQAKMKEVEKVKSLSTRGRRQDGKAERKRRREKGKRGIDSGSRRDRRSARSRSESSSRSIDSMGRDRKRERSASPRSSSSLSPPSRRERRKARSSKRGRRSHEEMGSRGKEILGWRGTRALSESPETRRGWSDASSLGSISSDRGTDLDINDEADVAGGGRVAMMDGFDDVPPDPHRPEHDDRRQRWDRGWRAMVSAGMEVGDGSDSESGRSRRGRHRRHRRQGTDDWEETVGRSKRRSRHRRGRSRSRSRTRSPGDGSSARSLSRSISRDRRSRRSSRSRSRSLGARRSRSRDREEESSSVTRLIKEYSRDRRKDKVADQRAESSTSAAAEDDAAAQRRADLVATWTHDLFDDINTASPPRSSLPPGYKPDAPTWVSRAGGVYIPLKPAET